ncbi:MAG: EpsI family protein [Deferrisomatales bacterium]|nr:EpsI family protein [Deferrisomatales bacterium]
MPTLRVARLWLLVFLVLATAGYTRFLSDVRAVPSRAPLGDVPLQIGEWRGRGSEMEQKIVDAVGVEDYLLRTYRRPDGRAVSVYVGFYEQQREGDTIHSPKHCLPGAGWRPVKSDRVEFETPGFNGGVTAANRYLIAKGDQRQLVLYWYQSRGRNIVSEYSAKMWLVVDSVVRKRNDGSLVRFMMPLSERSELETEQAELVSFCREFLPELKQVLPD